MKLLIYKHNTHPDTVVTAELTSPFLMMEYVVGDNRYLNIEQQLRVTTVTFETQQDMERAEERIRTFLNDDAEELDLRIYQTCV